ncbi:spore germination protein GerPC [Bacillus methanolicus]|uniref:Spore germination protein GerPC n=1 Tax=Bacillus methanolicus (strain MGA3 / ATCC 53907) TaxID=796606 RepID=I3E7J8_BACMM|nr:spore germination protein GerPC [Bacillus methanolicus]AIE59295.1 spore germination protein GerPC [Bacillus methanolicus MGA3]EIJ82469.1 putative spore germination protein [Bacillus methanolicus MGA3]UQD51368.1 spore gernimation protein [Bacillus methanolicus]
MNQEFYQYIQKMHLFIQAQERKIRQLEKTIESIQNQLTELKERPGIRVDKIEYKFDQLKVETLEGTLNIGLNPSDLQGIEDFSVDNQQLSTSLSPKDRMQTVMELENNLYHYLETEIEPLIKQTQEKLNVKIDESYTDFIKEDIKKQIPTRIEFYLRQNPQIERSTEDWKEKIITQMKKEIENGVFVFIRNLPDNVKGMMKE